MEDLAQQDLAFKQRIQKEKWHPTDINREFTKTLDVNRLSQKYGEGHKTTKDTYKLSKFDLNKLLNDQRRYKNNNFTVAEQQVLNELTPADSESVQVWNDRGYKVNELIYNENLLNGKVGYYSFDNDIQRHNEQRFKDNLERRKRQVGDNALHAREALRMTNDDTLYCSKAEHDAQ